MLAQEIIRTKRDAITLRRRDPETHRLLWGTADDRTDVLIRDMDASGIDTALIQPSGGAGPEDVARAIRELGPERAMFGTDWCDIWRELNEPAGIYPHSLQMVEAAGLSATEREWVLGKTAATPYGV